MSDLIWPAPAKINLFLHVLGRRADGYHELQTVFQFLDFGDELKFSLRTDGQIHLHADLQDVPTDQNLIVRAARLLQKTSQTSLGIDITLIKHIPMGAGLGGGSSDAATTLVALNQLWQLGFSQDELLTLGLQLGADVPIFIQGKAAWAEGIGEHFTPLNLPERCFVVMVPPVSVPTAEIFSAAELTRHTSAITIQQFLAGTVATQNDCESVVCQRYPLVREALAWLNQHAPAQMTGTGSCIFAAINDRMRAQTIVQQIPQPFYGFVANGLNDSPLSNVRG